MKTYKFIGRIIRFAPVWLSYLQYAPIYIWLSIKARSLTFFSAANPKMKFGGMMSNPKYELLKNVPECYVPKSVLIKQTSITPSYYNEQINFPVIAKPNEGERGWGVEKVESSEQLQQYLNDANRDTLVQDYIDYDIELSILYYRYPLSARGHISSIALKGFKTITGNGKFTLRTLIQLTYPEINITDLPIYLANKLDSIVPQGEVVKVNCIGNIARGAYCVNFNHIINARIIDVFDNIASYFPEFYYGRFDLKVPSLDHLQSGVDIKILELNGTNCQPMHVFDSKTGWWERYKAFYRHFHTIYKIAKINHSLGVKYCGINEFIKDCFFHWKVKLA